MFLTSPKLQMNPVLKKKKFQAVNFLAHACIDSDVKASYCLHCYCRGKTGAEFEDNNAKEVNPQLKTNLL